MELIKVTSDGQLEINEQTVEFLKKRAQEISSLLSLQGEQSDFQQQSIFTCAVVGKQKTGKSFLLNQLIAQSRKQQKGASDEEQRSTTDLNRGFSESTFNHFPVSSTLQPQTKGIWVSDFVPIKHLIEESAEDLSQKFNRGYILFLDTQSLDSSPLQPKGQKVDQKIFILSYLMSSVLMFNSVGVINEYILNGLSVSVEMAKMMRISLNGEGEKNASDLGELPKHNADLNFGQNKSREGVASEDRQITLVKPLLWVLRDFSFEFLSSSSNSPISKSEYLENCLQDVGSSSQRTYSQTSKNSIRKSIRSLFSIRKCSSLVLPFDQKGRIRKEFQEGLPSLYRNLFQLIVSSKKMETEQRKQFANRRRSSNICEQLDAFTENVSIYVNLLNRIDSAKGGELLHGSQHGLMRQVYRQQYLHLLERCESKVKAKIQQYISKHCGNPAVKQQFQAECQFLRQSVFFQKVTSELVEQIESHQTYRDYHSLHHRGLTSEKVFHRELPFGSKNKDVASIIERLRSFYENGIKQLMQKQQSSQRLQKSSKRRVALDHSKQHQLNSISQTLVQEFLSYFQLSMRSCFSISELEQQYEQMKSEFRCLFSEERKKNPSSSSNMHTSNALSLLQKDMQNIYMKRKCDLLQNVSKQIVPILKEELQCLREIRGCNCQISNKSLKKNFQGQKLLREKTKGKFQLEKIYTPYLLIPHPNQVRVSLLKKVIRKDVCQVERSVLYCFHVRVGDKKWSLKRKLKDFYELQHFLSQLMPTFNQQRVFQQVCCLKVLKASQLREAEVEEIDTEKYLKGLIEMECVRNSRIFQKFIKVDKNFAFA